jgi:hypothetical protein
MRYAVDKVDWDRLFSFSPSISFHWCSILTYHHLEDKQHAHWRMQFRDIISPHQYEQQQQQAMRLYGITTQKAQLTYTK